MEKIFFFLTAICFAVACSGDGMSPEVPESGDTVYVDFSLQSSLPLTKGGADNGEAKVNNVSLLVFNSDGTRVGYEKFNSMSGWNLYLPGKKNIRIYAVVNSSYDFEKVTSLSAFRKVSSPFSSNNLQNFEMVGCVDTVLNSDCSLVIPVRRLAAKLHIESIRINNAVNSVTSSPNETVEWHDLTAVYLMNAASSYLYSQERSSYTYYLGKDEDNPLLYHTMSSSYSTTSEGGVWYDTYSEPMDFYCYPNTSRTTPTNLVLYLEGTKLISGSGGGYYVVPCSHYYYIKLPELTPNTLYDIRQLTVENVAFDSGPSSSGRSLDLKVEYSMDVKDVSGEKILKTLNKKEVAYAL